MVRIIFIVGLILCFFTTFAAAKDSPKIGYTGAETCKKCHRKTWRSWNKTKMAQSFDILKPNSRIDAKKKADLDPNRDYSKDRKCLPCHTTGYGQPGGFVSVEKTPLLVGVQCESCHGPGKECSTIMELRGRTYELQELMEAGLRPKPVTVCSTCHNADSPTLTKETKAVYDAATDQLAVHKKPKLQYHQYKPGEKEKMIEEFEKKTK